VLLSHDQSSHLGTLRFKKLWYFLLYNLSGWWFLVTWGCDVCVWWGASSIDWRNIRRGSWRATKISTSQSCYLAPILLSRFFFPFFSPLDTTHLRKKFNKSSKIVVCLSHWVSKTLSYKKENIIFYMDLIS
jgi:hypothetical protein